MDVDRDRYQRATELFQRACALGAADRDAFLRREASGDALLYSLAVSLVRNDESSEDPFVRATGHISAIFEEGAGREPKDVLLPERIGGFAIRRRIGEGGMGIVYEAEQENPRRIVALKVVRPGMTSPRNLRRFEHETEALARLEHPGIATIHEAGVAETPWGTVPYFAMERVVGRPLFEFAATARLTPQQKADLLARICDAVEHAHGKGVIHRDLKSSNILVDAQGNPKILDFGVARIVEDKNAANTQLTLEGQAVGTLATMSPEQVRGDLERIDARSDVYSLGAIAYEILSGKPPLALEGKSFAEAARIVEEVDPPLLSTVNPALRGDLEVIVAKALEKDPEHRYASATALAADLRRHLRDEPILARPPSTATLIAKFARRNRVAVVAGIVGIGSLAAGATGAIWKAVESKRNEVSARRQEYRAEISAAIAALQVHDVAEAARQLEQAPAELRSWEWLHLKGRLDESVGVIPADSGWMDVSPDGRRVASMKGNFTIHSAADGSLIAENPEDFPYVLAVRFTTDGREVLVAFRNWSTKGLELRTFESSTAKLVSTRTFPATGTDKGIMVASFDRRGDRIAVNVDDRRMQIFDVKSAQLVSQWPMEEVESIPRFDGTGELVGVANLLGFQVRRVADGSLVFQRENLGGAQAVRFSGDGSRIAVAMFEPSVRICDARTGADLRRLWGHAGPVTDLQLLKDGHTLATGSIDGTLRLWDLESGRQRRALHGHQGPIQQVLLDPSEDHIWTAGDDGTIRKWSESHLSDPYVLDVKTTVYGIAFSPDGARLAVTTLQPGNPALGVWDASTGTHLAEWIEGEATGVAWSPDGSRIAVGRHTRPTLLLDAANGATIALTSTHFYNTDSLVFDSSSRWLATSGLDGMLRLADAKSGNGAAVAKLGPSQTESSPIYRCVFGGRGEWIAASRFDKSIGIYDCPTLALRASLTGPAAFVVSLAASPDGRLLAAGTVTGEIWVWRMPEGSLLTTLRGHTQEVFSLAFHPSEPRLASGGRDRSIRLWDTTDWTGVARLEGHVSFVYGLAFDESGKVLASGSGDGTVRLWDSRSRAERHRLSRERERIVGEVGASVAEALAGTDSRAALEVLRSHPSWNARTREVAMQEALRKSVESRPR